MIALFSTGLFACSEPTWGLEVPNPPIRDTGVEHDDWAEDSGDWEDTGEEGPWSGQWGEVIPGEEAYTGFFDFDGANVLCDIVYPLNGETPAQGCPGCSPALSFTYGAAEVGTNVGGRCESLGWTGMTGQVLAVGHAAPETLYRLDGGTWTAVGFSTMDGEVWVFETE